MLSDRNRTATKNFKYRRNQPRGQKSSQNSQKEAKKGKTYETAVALNLDWDTSVNQPTLRTHTHIGDLFENICDNELHEYEKLVPSYYAQPDLPKLTYDPYQTYTFVVFNTETSCTVKIAELCQLSAIHVTCDQTVLPCIRRGEGGHDTFTCGIICSTSGCSVSQSVKHPDLTQKVHAITDSTRLLTMCF